MFRFSFVRVGLAALVLLACMAAAQTTSSQRVPDVPYMPATEAAVHAMLKLASVKSSDVVYDLGCGDGRLVIAAAKEYGAHGDTYTATMVRPERRVVLADERSVRVSVGAPGSRPQPEGEIRQARAGRQKPVKEQGARKRAATISERCSLVTVSAERCLKGPSRSCHGEGNRQHSGPERVVDLSGVWGGGTFPEKNAEQERPYLAVNSDKDEGVNLTV